MDTPNTLNEFGWRLFEHLNDSKIVECGAPHVWHENSASRYKLFSQSYHENVYIGDDIWFVLNPKVPRKYFSENNDVILELEKELKQFIPTENGVFEKEYFRTRDINGDKYLRFGTINLFEILGKATRKYDLSDTLGNHVETVSSKSMDMVNRYTLHIVPFDLVAQKAQEDRNYAFEIRKNALKDMDVKLPWTYFW